MNFLLVAERNLEALQVSFLTTSRSQDSLLRIWREFSQ
jgi:hypothetical protein